MSEYLQIPTLPPQDLLQSIEAVSPYARIHRRQSRQNAYRDPPSPSEKGRNKRAERRFTVLRRLIEILEESANIIKLDYATAEAEMLQMGLKTVEENLIPQLLHLKIPLQGIEKIQQQIAAEQATISLGHGRLIQHEAADLFPVPTPGLREYLLKIGHLQLQQNSVPRNITNAVEEEGFYTAEVNRLRLAFSADHNAMHKPCNRLSLRIITRLGVVENEEDGRRAILFPRADKTYGLYADKMIDLSI
jgi:hypothetical protein